MWNLFTLACNLCHELYVQLTDRLNAGISSMLQNHCLQSWVEITFNLTGDFFFCKIYPRQPMKNSKFWRFSKPDLNHTYVETRQSKKGYFGVGTVGVGTVGDLYPVLGEDSKALGG